MSLNLNQLANCVGNHRSKSRSVGGGSRGHTVCQAQLARLRRPSFAKDAPRNVATNFITSSEGPTQAEPKIDVLQQFSHLKLRGVPRRTARRERVQSYFDG